MKFALITLAAMFAGSAAGQAQTVSITGAGSSFAAPLYGKWAEDGAAATGVKLNYQSVGSGAGQKLVIARTVDFGASDAPLTPAKLHAAKLLQFPTAMGAESIAINLPGIGTNQLRLSGPVLAAIYSGKITKWNAPEIAAINPGVTLPDLAVAPVYRADGSGTTFVFTTYLSKISPEFASSVGAATAVQWPAGTGAKGNAGVAAAVNNTIGGIGYVEAAYAVLNHLTTTQLQNHDGQFVTPTHDAFVSAAAHADWLGAKNFAVDLTDQPGATSWPIVSATFVLLPTNATDPKQTAAVKKLFAWAFTSGDASATSLQYVTLPEAVKTAVRTSWQGVGG